MVVFSFAILIELSVSSWYAWLHIYRASQLAWASGPGNSNSSLSRCGGGLPPSQITLPLQLVTWTRSKLAASAPPHWWHGPDHPQARQGAWTRVRCCQPQGNSSMVIPLSDSKRREAHIGSLATHSLTSFSARGSPARCSLTVSLTSSTTLWTWTMLPNCSKPCTDLPALCQLMSSLAITESETTLKSGCNRGTCHHTHSLSLLPFLLT